MAPVRSQAHAGPPSRTLLVAGLVVAYLTTLAQLGRALTMVDRGDWVWYLGLGAVLLLLVTLTIRFARRRAVVHGSLVVQCLIVVALYLLEPQLDYVTALFTPVAFEAAVIFTGPVVWWWVAVVDGLIAASLIVQEGLLGGLALGLVSIAAATVLAAFAVVLREIEESRRRSLVMLDELQATHARLREYASRAGELAAVEERDRIAGELSESVSRSISDILADAASARVALAGPGPLEAQPRLTTLQAETQEALARMRRLITELRPKGDQAKDEQPPGDRPPDEQPPGEQPLPHDTWRASGPAHNG